MSKKLVDPSKVKEFIQFHKNMNKHIKNLMEAIKELEDEGINFDEVFSVNRKLFIEQLIQAQIYSQEVINSPIENFVEIEKLMVD